MTNVLAVAFFKSYFLKSILVCCNNFHCKCLPNWNTYLKVGIYLRSHFQHIRTRPEQDSVDEKQCMIQVKSSYLTLSQCTLAGLVYTGMPLECHWLTQCTLGYHWATQRILAVYTGTPLEKLSWNSSILECQWRNLVEFAPHWDATGETLTFATYTGIPRALEELWQPTHALTHIIKHA